MNATESSDARLRTPAAILEAAARLLAEDGDASMADLAGAAGVGRATLYRYYPSREALLGALTAEALDELAGRLADAGLETAGVEEAIGRIVRAVLTVGDRYAVLVRERVKADPDSRGTGLHRADPTRSRARDRRGICFGTTSQSTSSSRSSAACSRPASGSRATAGSATRTPPPP